MFAENTKPAAATAGKIDPTERIESEVTPAGLLHILDAAGDSIDPFLVEVCRRRAVAHVRSPRRPS